MTISGLLLSDAEREWLVTRFPELKAGVGEYCPTCQTTGSYVWRGETHVCDCAEQLRLHKRYLACGIGKPYQRLWWDDVDTEVWAQLEPIHDYLEFPAKYVNRGVGVYLWGPPGTGKTLISTLILKSLILSGYTGFSATSAEMVEMFTAGWRGNTDEQTWFSTKFLRSQVLLLDELRRDTRLAETTFDHVLRTRVHGGRPTILTTNLTPTQLESGYGSSVLSLLVEQSLEVHLTLPQNYRARAHERMLAEIKSGEVRPIR